MSIEVSNLDHLGVVAGIIDEIGIEQKINQLLGEQLPEKITGGQAVKGMLLNGLGLVSSPLYPLYLFIDILPTSSCAMMRDSHTSMILRSHR